jgi:hypothetical protein
MLSSDRLPGAGNAVRRGCGGEALGPERARQEVTNPWFVFDDQNPHQTGLPP